MRFGETPAAYRKVARMRAPRVKPEAEESRVFE
jgi:hypothetical protein